MPRKRRLDDETRRLAQEAARKLGERTKHLREDEKQDVKRMREVDALIKEFHRAADKEEKQVRRSGITLTHSIPPLAENRKQFDFRLGDHGIGVKANQLDDGSWVATITGRNSSRPRDTEKVPFASTKEFRDQVEGLVTALVHSELVRIQDGDSD